MTLEHITKYKHHMQQTPHPSARTHTHWPGAQQKGGNTKWVPPPGEAPKERPDRSAAGEAREGEARARGVRPGEGVPIPDRLSRCAGGST